MIGTLPPLRVKRDLAVLRWIFGRLTLWLQPILSTLATLLASTLVLQLLSAAMRIYATMESVIRMAAT